MKRWLPFNLLLCTFCICFVLPLSLNAAPVRQAQVVLQIHNQTKQTICYIYLTNGTTPNWGEDQLGNDTILAGETYFLSINPGNYDLLLVDCEGNLLLDKRNLSINHNDILPLTAVDVTRTSCEAYHFRGVRAWQNAQYDDALADLQVALPCFRHLGDDTDEAITLNNIGLVYYSLHRYDEALQSLKASLILRRSVNDRSGESITLDNIGGVYQAQGRYTEALANFEKALTIRQALGDRAGEGATLNHIGLAYFNQGLYTEALAHFRKALAIHQVIGDRATESTTLSNIGGVYHAQGLYIEALANYESARAILQATGDHDGEGVILNNIGGIYDNQGRHAEAIDSYQAALTLAEAAGDRQGQATTLNNIGSSYYSQGRYAEALASHEQALKIFRDIGDRRNESATLTNIGSVFKSQGRYTEALANHEQALTILQEIGDRFGEGKTLTNIGLVYDSQGRYTKALVSYKRALAIQQTVGDQRGESTTLNNIGLAYFNQARYNEALSHFMHALSIHQAIGDRTGEGTNLSNVGGVYSAQGRYAEALDFYNRALIIQQMVGDVVGEGVTWLNIASVYYSQGRYVEALATYEQILTFMQKVGDHKGESSAYNGIGSVYYAQGRYNEALAIYKDALTILTETDDRAGISLTLNNIGGIYQAQESYPEALASYTDALTIMRSIGDRSGEGAALNNIGGVYEKQGRYTEALANYESALLILRDIGERVSAGKTLNNIARVYARQGHYANALQTYSEGIDLLETIRSTAGTDQARASFVNDYIAAYDQIIALYQQQGAIDLAFWYSERGRARVLLDTIDTGQVQLNDNPINALLIAEQDTYAVRQSAQDTLAKARATIPLDSRRIAAAEAELHAAEATYEQAVDAITAHSQTFANLIPGRQQVPQLAAVQRWLATDTTLISYWLFDEKTIAFLVTANDVNLIELPHASVSNIAIALRSLYAWRNIENPYPRPLRQLYQWLVEPLAGQITTHQIMIVPHSILHYAPFAALTDGVHYFGEQYTLSLLPSASVLPFLTQNATRSRANPSQSAVVFGNPATIEPGLSPLVYAVNEALVIAEMLHTTAYTGTSASETQLRASATDARIIHLAAHGSYNLFDPLYSLIALAADETQDGRLETHEIFGLPLAGNDLVVLSACQSNLGNLSRGDDTISLTRAFFFAGTPTVIASLWNVDDAATKSLMVAFYKYWLQDGTSKAEALQAAQADVRADPRWVSPFYWAGFVLNGNPGKRQTAIKHQQ